MINLARALRLDVVAEGVETGEQLHELLRLGCGRAQGFYFSRPVPAPEFATLLRERPRLGLLELVTSQRA